MIHDKNKNMEMSNKEKVIALLKSIETGSKKPSQVINADKYVQHNLLAHDGLEGFLATWKMSGR